MKIIWKIRCLDMFNVPLLLTLEKEVEDEVKPANKETTVQVSDTTMMTREKMLVTKKKIKI